MNITLRVVEDSSKLTDLANSPRNQLPRVRVWEMARRIPGSSQNAPRDLRRPPAQTPHPGPRKGPFPGPLLSAVGRTSRGDARDHLEQHVRSSGLLQECTHLRPVASANRVLVIEVVGGVHDDRWWIVESIEHAQTVDAWHVQIEEDDVDVYGPCLQVLQTFVPVSGFDHAVPFVPKKRSRRLTHDGTIFDDENGDAFFVIPEGGA